MRQQVDHRLRGPVALIEVEAILREAGKVHSPEVGTARRPVGFVLARPVEVRRGLAEVVEAGPDELAEHAGALLLRVELDVGDGGPRWRDPSTFTCWRV